MGNGQKYLGVSFDNLRKSLYLLFFGHQNGGCNSFEDSHYKYIIPMQGSFDNPLFSEGELSKDTYCMFWIEDDESLTQDDYVEMNEVWYSRQKCVARILLRFVGKDAETWCKSIRHLCKRDNVTKIWSGVMMAERLEQTMPVIPRKIMFSGRDGQIAFDIRFKLYYDELMDVNWKELDGIDFKTKGTVYFDGKTST